MRVSALLLLLATALSLCARPYTNRVKIADETRLQALKGLGADDQKTLAQGLSEAGGWLKRKQKFAAKFPQATQQFKASGLQVDF